MGALNEALWHRVRLGQGEFPIITAADYEFTANEPVQHTLQYERQCTKEEFERLYKVFNFNFLPDAALGGEVPGAPIVPSPPSGGWRPSITSEQASSSQATAQLQKGSHHDE